MGTFIDKNGRLAALGAVLAIAGLGLVGCGSGGSADGGVSTDSGESIVISVEEAEKLDPGCAVISTDRGGHTVAVDLCADEDYRQPTGTVTPKTGDGIELWNSYSNGIEFNCYIGSCIQFEPNTEFPAVCVQDGYVGVAFDPDKYVYYEEGMYNPATEHVTPGFISADDKERLTPIGFFRVEDLEDSEEDITVLSDMFEEHNASGYSEFDHCNNPQFAIGFDDAKEFNSYLELAA